MCPALHELTENLSMRLIWYVVLAVAVAVSPLEKTYAVDDGIVRIKSAYSMPETIKRLKKDVADKGIMFFDEIDQSKLAADAGVTLRPSTLLVFGNPPLGTLFLTSNPAAGLDWPEGVKRTWRGLVSMSANDPKRTSSALSPWMHTPGLSRLH